MREYFGTNPPNAAEAYRRAYAYKGLNADVLAVRLMRRPAIQQAIAEGVAQSKSDGILDMRERRQFLARVVRDKRRFAAPDAGTRIRALSEDAILAGERRTDGTQVTIGGDLNLSVVLQSLRVGALLQPPSIALAEKVVEPLHVPRGTETAAIDVIAASPARSPAGAILGPLGWVRPRTHSETGGRVVGRSTSPGLGSAPFAADD